MSGVGGRLGWFTLLSGQGILSLSLDPGLRARVRIVRAHRRRITRVLAVLSALLCLLVIVGVGETEYGAALQASWGC